MNELILITAKYSGRQVAINPKMVVSIERKKTADDRFEYCIALIGDIEYDVLEDDYQKLVKYFPIIKPEDIKYD